MNIKETKKVCKTITLNTICKAYVQENSLILIVGIEQEKGSNSYYIPKDYFPFIYTHLN